MSDQTATNVIQRTYAKDKFDVCNKVLAKTSIRKYKKDQHNVIVVNRKKINGSNKKDDDFKKKKEASKVKEVVENDAWSKVWTSESAPAMSTIDMEEQLSEIEIPQFTLSTGLFNDYMMERSDSILEEVEEMEKNIVDIEWFGESTQVTFESQFGQELRRLSIPPACNDCKTTKAELNDIRKQYDNLLKKSERIQKASNHTKSVLRNQLKLSEQETDKTKDEWVEDMEKASEEIDEFKRILHMKEKENMELVNKIETEKASSEKLPFKKKDCEEIGAMCNVCGLVVKNMQTLRGHIKFVHFTCPACNTNCKTSDEVKKHTMKCHSEKTRYTCEKCKMLFPNNKALEAHQERRHIQIYQCQVCNREFEIKKDMMRHMKNAHTEKNQRNKNVNFQCMVCEHKSETDEALVNHLADVHNLHDITDDKKKYEGNQFNCALCDHIEDSEHKLVKHLEIVHKLVDVSSKTSTNKTSLNQSRVNPSVNQCENGPSCWYLRENRCRYFHEEAAQSEEGWKEVRSRRNHNNNNLQNKYHSNQPNKHQSQANKHHNHQHNQQDVSWEGVQWCRLDLNCTRGRRCKYRHPDGRPGFVIQRRVSGQTLGDFFPTRNQRMRV